MNLNFNNEINGLAVNGKYRLSYPKDVWQRFPDKEFLTDNLAHLLTVTMPLVAGFKKVKYNTSKPLFYNEFKEVVRKSIPSAVDDYNISAKKTMKRFDKIKYEFASNKIKKPRRDYELDEGAVIPISFGKDSLLTLGVCREIGLKTVPVYINDTVSPGENRTKLRYAKKLGSKVVTNELEKLNDFETWNKGESCLGYSHMLTSFCFISIPLMAKYKCKYIVPGNQQDMNFTFKTKEGIKTFPSFDQTTIWMRKQNKMINRITGGNVFSAIEPLTDIAITKILHTRYKKLGRCQTSCGELDGTREKRWCHACNSCSDTAILMRAFGANPKDVGLRSSFLEKKHQKLYCLFGGKKTDSYDRSKDVRDEQLLEFYLAYKEGARGYLIDKFRKKFLDEAKEREDELRKKFFRIYPSIMPKKIERKVNSIYKEELKDLV